MRCKLIGLAVSLLLLFAAPLQAAEIPLGSDGGIYTVPVQINGALTMQFLVDPGAGVVVIPMSVLRTLVDRGTITKDDVIGLGAAELADSSFYVTAKVRLRELRIGNMIVRDVTAAVAPGLTQALLGQSFLRRFASVTFDNQRRVMILSETAPPAAPAWGSPFTSYPGYPSYPVPLSGSSNYPQGYAPGAGR